MRASRFMKRGVGVLVFSDVAIYGLAYDAWGDRSNAVIAGAIALAESGGDRDAVGDNFASGHQTEDSPYRWDRGLWQVNSVHGFDPERLLDDAVYNASCAFGVWRWQGFPAWSTFKGGQFREFVPRMEAAADSVVQWPAPVVLPGAFSRDDLVPLWKYMFGYGGGVLVVPIGFQSDGRRRYELVLP